MADKTYSTSFGDVKYHDNGDGTYSPVIFSGGSNGTGASTTGVYNATPGNLGEGDSAALLLDITRGLITNPKAMSKDVDSVLAYPRGGNYINLTASGLVLSGAGKIQGIFVASATATPTIKVWDSTAASGAVLVNTFTPVAGTFYPLGSMGARVSNGGYVTISGTVDCTVFYDPTTT